MESILNVLGDYRFIAVSSYLTSLSCFVLAGLIILANPRALPCRLASSFNLCVSIWAFFYGNMLIWEVGYANDLYSRILTLFALLLAAFYTHLIVLLRNVATKFRRAITLNYVYAAIIGVLVIFNDDFVIGSVPKLDLPAYTEAGKYYFLVPVHTSMNVLLCTLLILSGLKIEKGAKKQQLKLLLGATVIGFCTGMSSYLLVFNVPVKPILNPLVIMNPLLVVYAIIKHRFLDIRKLVKNSIVFSALFFCLLAIVSALLFVFQQVLVDRAGFSESTCRFIAILFALLLYSPVKRGLTLLTQRLLYQHIQNPSEIFKRLSEDLFQVLDVQKLADAMTHRLSESLTLEKAAFFYKRENKFLNLAEAEGEPEKSLEEESALVRYLEYNESALLNPYGSSRKDDAPHIQSIDDSERLKNDALAFMVLYEWAVALPVFMGRQAIGIILLGHKKSDAVWTDDEIAVLESFAHSFALALANARAAENIRELQRRISAGERDASAGALIAGVDHEAKNPLHAASLALSALEGYFEKPGFTSLPRDEQERTVKETMEGVLQDIAEVNDVIEHLSNLAEQKPLKIQENLLFESLFDKALKVANLHEDIAINKNIEPNMRLTCDAAALQEILVNLLRNAVQAGALELQVRAFTGEDNEKVIEVSDNGKGISQNIRERIFEPFFTTKERSQDHASGGSGMGLFIVREYMRAMAGDIKLLPSSRTRFQLCFNNPMLASGVKL